MLNIGIVGLGFMGRIHFLGAKGLKGARVVAGNRGCGQKAKSARELLDRGVIPKARNPVAGALPRQVLNECIDHQALHMRWSREDLQLIPTWRPPTRVRDFSRSYPCKSLFNFRQQRAEVVNVVAWSPHDNDADAET